MDNGPHPDSSHQTSNGEMEAPHRLCPSPMDWWQQDSAQVPSAFVPNLSHVALISPRWPHIHDPFTGVSQDPSHLCFTGLVSAEKNEGQVIGPDPGWSP